MKWKLFLSFSFFYLNLILLGFLPLWIMSSWIIFWNGFKSNGSMRSKNCPVWFWIRKFFCFVCLHRKKSNRKFLNFLVCNEFKDHGTDGTEWQRGREIGVRPGLSKFESLLTGVIHSLWNSHLLEKIHAYYKMKWIEDFSQIKYWYSSVPLVSWVT